MDVGTGGEGVTASPYEVIGLGHDDGWADRRLLGVGASEAATMLGVEPRHGEGGPAILWAEKTGRHERDGFADGEWISWGHIMEPVIVEAFGSPRYADRPVRKTREHLRSLAHPWALATLDAWTRHPIHGWIPLEAKNVGAFMVDRWADGVPVEKWWQLQHQSLVTGAPCVSIAACVGGHSLMWDDVERDERAIATLVEAGASFWEHVLEDRVPAYRPTLETARVLYPPRKLGEDPEDGVEHLAGSEWRELDARLEEIKATARTLDRERKRIEALVRDAIGFAGEALLDDGTAYTLRTQHRRESTSPASSSRVLRRRAPRSRS